MSMRTDAMREAIATGAVPRSRARMMAMIAAAAFLATLAARWPGVAMYDTISQYEQATSGAFEDWHPPIMARTWSLLIRVWPGTEPFLVLQSLLWWGGLGLLAAALARIGKAKAGAAVLAVGAFPLFVGWDTVVLKDSQLASCLVAAMGLFAHWRLEGRRLPGGIVALILALIAYATLVRGNAVFATVPFAFALFDRGGGAPLWRRGALLLVTIAAVIVASPIVNHHILGAASSKVERALPLYDVIGTAHQAELSHLDGLTDAEWERSERLGCYTPYFWNPYGMPTQCQDLGEKVAFDAPSGAPLLKLWLRMVATYPVAWAEHRARHFNSNVRFLVGPHEADATPPANTEKNELGLGRPAGPAALALVAVAGWITATPLGWPFAWMALAAAFLWAGLRATGPVAALGRALAISAVLMSASYALVSIASDLRYHLWSMVAAALAVVLALAAGGLDRARLRTGLGLVALLCFAALLARITLPREPIPYPVAGSLPGSVARP